MKLMCKQVIRVQKLVGCRPHTQNTLRSFLGSEEPSLKLLRLANENNIGLPAAAPKNDIILCIYNSQQSSNYTSHSTTCNHMHINNLYKIQYTYVHTIPKFSTFTESGYCA